MSVKEEMYNNVSGGASSVTIEFTNTILTQDPSDANQIYYISFVPKGKDANGTVLPSKAAVGLNDLALNASVQSSANLSSDYTSINNLVADYMYDYINGHTANQFNSGATVQLPLNF